MNKNITNIEAAAIKGAAAKLEKTLPKIKRGTRSGIINVSVKYTLTKEKDSKQRATSNLLSQEVLAKAIVRSGINSGVFLANLYKVALAQMKAKKQVGPAVSEADKRVAVEIERLQERIVAKLPKVKKSGRTFVDAEIVKLDSNIPAQFKAGVEVKQLQAA